jgi:hypothetical protein
MNVTGSSQIRLELKKRPAFIAQELSDSAEDWEGSAQEKEWA